MASLKLHGTILVVLLTTTGFPLQPFSLSGLSPVLAQTSPQQTEGDRILEQGRQQFRTGQLQAALQSFQQALKLYQDTKNYPGEVKALRNIGNVFFVAGKVEEAAALYQQSLTLARQHKDLEGEAGALQNLGNVSEITGKYDQALDYAQQSIKIYRVLKDLNAEADVLGNIGNVYLQRSDYRQALDYYQKSLALLRQVKDRKTEGSTLGNIGLIYYSQGDYLKAIEYHKQHLAIAQEMNNLIDQIAVLSNLGNDYLGLGDYGQAITYLEQSLKIARDIGNEPGIGKALGNLGVLYQSIGNYSKAIEYQFQSLALARKNKDRRGEGENLGNLGNLYLVINDIPEAIKHHQQRLEIAKELEDLSGELIANNNLGNAYTRQGDYAKAQAAYQQSLQLSQKLGDKAGVQTALVNLGTLASTQKNYPKAIEYQEQALALAQQQQDLSSQGLTLNNLGNSYFLAGNLPKAETTLYQGLQVWETIRSKLGSDGSKQADENQVALFGQQMRTYRTLQQVLVAQQKTDAALEVTERGRARAFIELLSRRTATNRNTTALVKPINLTEIKQIAREQNATLVTYAVTYEDITGQGRADVREADLLTWVIQPTGSITFHRTDLRPFWKPGDSFSQTSELKRLVTSIRQSLGVGERGLFFEENSQLIAQSNSAEGRQATNESLRKLYQLLIAPIATQLPQDPNQRVIFIPQDSLFLAPFAALQDPDGRYLIEKHTISVAPSIQTLALTRQQRQRSTKTGDILVVGNPTMPRVRLNVNGAAQQLTSLPGAEQEAKTIARLFKTEALTGQQATEATVLQKMPKARIIHLATHGFLNLHTETLILQIDAMLAARQSSDPTFRSAPADSISLGDQAGAIALTPAPGQVALTPPGPNDGLITPSEILNLNLTAELVVLSACDTVGGRITGDGVLGLSRSLMAAGVPSVVVSLWQVPDQATSDLMTEFYRQLQSQPQPNKAQALRQAMLKTLKDYPDPRSWAAFILMGEAE